MTDTLTDLLREIIELAHDRDRGYAERQNGNTVNGRVADKLVALLPRMIDALATPAAPQAVGEIVAMVREIEVLLANCHCVNDIDIAAQHEAAMVLVKRIAVIAQPQPAAVPDGDTPTATLRLSDELQKIIAALPPSSSGRPHLMLAAAPLPKAGE